MREPLQNQLTCAALRSMGRGKAAPKIMVVHEGGAGDDADPTDGVPLFQGTGSEQIHAISVYRVGPVEEGTLGAVPPDADEAMVMSKYGGGIYRLIAKGQTGKIMGTRTITLSGEPKFQSKEAVVKHKIQLGELPAEAPKAPPAAPASGGLGVAEMFALMSQGHAQQLEMMRLQSEHQRHEAGERESRNRREAEEARARDREYQATLLSIMKRDDKAAAGGPLEMVNVLMQGLNLGRKIGAPTVENEHQDPVSTFLANLPAILEQGRGLVAAGQPPKPAGLPAAPPVPGRMYLDGPVAAKLAGQVKGLMGKGYTQAQALEIAEAALAAGVDQLASVPNAPATPPPPPATPDEVMPPTPPAPRPTPRKATGVRPRATRVR